MLSEIVFRSTAERKSKAGCAADACPVGRERACSEPNERKRSQARFLTLKMKDEITHVLILVQSEYLYVWTASQGLGNCIRSRVIPLEFETVVVTEQDACSGAIVGAVLDVDSMKE